MDVVSVAEMRELEREAIAGGVPSKELMRRAAQGVFDIYPGWAGSRTLIVCGPGNNGGDGYALAAIMKEQDLDVTLLRVSEKLSEDGSFYFERCRELGVPMLMWGTDPAEFKDFQVVVDCMLGTGFSGVPREPIGEVIGEINYARENAGVYVIAVDINSGINGDTGEAETAIVSDLTVSIGFYKQGLFRGKAPHLIGNLGNVEIGLKTP